MVAPVRGGDRVLDVGCNSGYIVDFLPRDCTVYGVDVSAELVDKARERMDVVLVAAAEALPYADHSMDVVVLGEILEHVYDPVAVLREAARVSRRIVVGSTPHELGKWGPSGTKPPVSHRFHVRCYTADTLRADIEAAGLYRALMSTVERGGTPQIHVFSAAIDA
jgi:ubiquinone/menaquinone biosynthesis C-methylase UbiE